MPTPQEQSYREIPLSQGKVALVDEADFEWLSQFNWCATFSPTGKTWYAMRGTRKGGKYRTIKMHRSLMGLEHGDLRQVDHINHDTLDNRRSNLRICTPAQNQHNTHKQSNNQSGYKGVFYDASHGKWVAKIMVDGKKHHLGYGNTPEECAEMYRRASKQMHGEFSYTESKS